MVMVCQLKYWRDYLVRVKNYTRTVSFMMHLVGFTVILVKIVDTYI